MGLFGGDELERLEKKGDLTGLVEMLRRERNKARIDEISRVIMKFGDRAVPHLLDLSTSDDNEEFHKGSRIILGMGKDIVPRLAAAVNEKDKDWEYRASAVRALSRIGDGRAAEPLRRAARSDARRSPLLLNQIAIALRELGDDTGIEVLIDCLDEADGPLQTGLYNAALEEIAGQKFGPDAAKWRQWLAAQRGVDKPAPEAVDLDDPPAPIMEENPVAKNNGDGELEKLAAYFHVFELTVTPEAPGRFRVDDPTNKLMTTTVVEKDGYFCLTSGYILGPLAGQRPDILTMVVCDMNKGSSLTRYYIDDDADLAMTAVLMQPVNPDSFATFMRLWGLDLISIHRGQIGEALGKFVRSK